MNFLKKYWLVILILLIFSTMIIIGYFATKNEQETLPQNDHEELESNKEQETLSNNHEELEDNKEPNQPSRNKREIDTPKSKIKITKEKFDKIVSYILSENENEVLSSNNLKPEETTAIEEARKSHKLTLSLLKKDKETINKEQEKCDNLTNQRDSAINQIPPLQTQKQQKEAELANKNKEIDKLKLEKKNKKTQLQTQGISIYKNDELDKIQKNIEKLQNETTPIVQRIMECRRQIADLTADVTMYTEMLTMAEDYKQKLKKDYDNSQNRYGNPLKNINSLYDITPSEG